MKKRFPAFLTLVSVIIFNILISCNSPVEPASGNTPGGRVIAWFNGLGSTVDLYFPGDDSLVSSAYITGDAPNDILYLGSDRMALLSSLSSVLQIVDLSVSGSILREVSFPPGSNPWAITFNNSTIWVTLLLSGQITSVSAEDWTVGNTLDVPEYPYGIEVAGGSIFVSHGDYYPNTTPGGVTVIDAATLQNTGWIDTGANTTELWYCAETGKIHAFSSTYGSNDGVVSIIDPATATVSARIQTGGNPHSPCRTGNSFACCDAWGHSIFFYDESGALLSTWTPDSLLTLAGIAVDGDTLYMTDFNSDRVYIANISSKVILDSLKAGDGPQSIIKISR